AIVILPPPIFEVRIAWRCGSRRLLLKHSCLDILLADDGRSLAGIRKLIREKRTRNAGIGAGGLKLRITTDVIGMKAGVDDELNRFRADLSDRLDDFLRESACA